MQKFKNHTNKDQSNNVSDNDIIYINGKTYKKLHGNLFGSVLTKSQWE